MPLTKLFKILIFSLFITSIISIAAGEILIDTLPIILQDYIVQIDLEYYSSDFSIFDVIAIIIGIFAIAVLIGMWKFKNWARHLYIILVIVSLSYYYVDGPIVMNPFEAMFSDFSCMIDGILIYMMYMTPLSNIFKLKANKNEEPEEIKED